MTVADASQTIDCAVDHVIDGGGCGGTVGLAELIEDLDPTPGVPEVPATCSAVLWGADDLLEGWVVRLADATGGDLRVVIDQPCDQVVVQALDESPEPSRPFAVVVVVFDTVTGERFTLPVSLASVATGVCSIPPMTCAPPQ